MLQSKPAAIIHKLLNKMRTIKQSAHWARGGTWSPCCFLPVNLSISDGQKIDARSPAYVYVAGGHTTFLSFLAGKKETKNTWKKLDLRGKYAPTSIHRTWKNIVVFNWLDKRPTKLLQDEGKKLAKFKTVSNLYGNENCNSKFLRDFRGKKKPTYRAK